MKKIGIIGAGNLGCAIAKGFITHGKIAPSEIYLSRRRNGLLADKEKEGYIVSDNLGLVKECDLVILAVLPGQAEEVVKEICDELGSASKILVSVVSAVSINELKEWTGNGVEVVRVMPNTAIEYGASMTCIAGEEEQSVMLVKSLFLKT